MKLLYVGRNYADFRNEALKYGVSRVTPFSQLKNLCWGESVLLAKYKPDLENKTREKDKRFGTAEMIGAFPIESVLIMNKKVSEELNKRLARFGKVAYTQEVE